jgi:hypothetical protein
MNKKYVKIAVFTVLGLATIYGGYRLVRFARDKKEQRRLEDLIAEAESTDAKEEVIASNKGEKQETAKPSFDGNKIISKGSKGTEAKTVQLALNNIIEDAKKVNLLALKANAPASSGSVSDWATEPLKAQAELERLGKIAKRVTQIASLPKLVADGDFGAKSVSVCQVIMGTSSTTYNKVMQKRIDFSKAYGLPNPYNTKKN